MLNKIEIGSIWEMSTGGHLIGIVTNISYPKITLRFSMGGGHSIHFFDYTVLEKCYKEVTYD
jgi:hypothetical protein